jgi:hypothetical protein
MVQEIFQLNQLIKALNDFKELKKLLSRTFINLFRKSFKTLLKKLCSLFGALFQFKFVAVKTEFVEIIQFIHTTFIKNILIPAFKPFVRLVRIYLQYHYYLFKVGPILVNSTINLSLVDFFVAVNLGSVADILIVLVLPESLFCECLQHIRYILCTGLLIK